MTRRWAHKLVTRFQARSQDFGKEGGGLFWKVGKIISDLDQNFHCFEIRLRRFFRPKAGDLKKKVFTENETEFSAEITNSNSSSSRITATHSKLRLSNPFGGAVFIFGAKTGLKSTKNMRFCILFRPMGGL